MPIERAAEHWPAIKATIVDTKILVGKNRSDVNYTASFTVDGRDYTYQETVRAPYYQAQNTADKMMGTQVDVRYNPTFPSNCMSENTLTTNKGMAVIAPWLIGITGIAGFLTLVAGCLARPIDTTLQTRETYQYDR